MIDVNALTSAGKSIGSTRIPLAAFVGNSKNSDASVSNNVTDEAADDRKPGSGGEDKAAKSTSTTSSIGAAAGAVAQPSPALNSNRNQLDNSLRQSNLLDTPSSKGGHLDDE